MKTQAEVQADINTLERAILELDIVKKKIENKYGLDARLPARAILSDLNILIEIDETTQNWDTARVQIKDIVLGQV